MKVFSRTRTEEDDAEEMENNSGLNGSISAFDSLVEEKEMIK